ncbi:MAG: beta-galactosidase GalB [Flavisolibacter sp.]
MAGDENWRIVNLPHDWSIEGNFDVKNPAGTNGAALPGGMGWYRKTFTLSPADKEKKIFIDFDGVYRNSEVWINGHSLGIRPNGYISFRYELTPYLKFNEEKNLIVVKVDNSQQPNSRWYSGSGIYRNVWLVKTNNIYVDQWGSYISTVHVSKSFATIDYTISLAGADRSDALKIKTIIYDPQGKAVSTSIIKYSESQSPIQQSIRIPKPALWSLAKPSLYSARTTVLLHEKPIDNYETLFGIRTFQFDSLKGFFLNGRHVKINGVCNHHDLGALGAAVNYRALERQLQLLKQMGCNAIRTSHNPPAPELLDLTDKMGFIVMDEAFDMWKKGKTKYDYHLYWDQWHKKDLEDQVRRDRNHPSVFIWSIGNEIPEQWSPKDSSGTKIAIELAAIIHSLDISRPITTANNNPTPQNYIIKSEALDLIGYNYNQNDYANFHSRFAGKKFIATETVSALQTRGHYDMPSDSIRRWPRRWDVAFNEGNADTTVSAYDNVSTPWGSTHEETMKVMKKYDFLSGQFIWTGFDYLGEPTPYPWPARSSYFGIIDLAGFPKDVYYMYQSEWTAKSVLHLFPHWNWKMGQTVDLWAYYNNADEVELFLNDKSLGTRKKNEGDLHVMWRTVFTPGKIKAISRKNGKVIKTCEIRTAGDPYRIVLTADRPILKATGTDLSFITAKIVDEDGTLVPEANTLIKFSLTGPAFIAGTDNGSQTDLQSFKSQDRKALNGLALAIVQSSAKGGNILITAEAENLKPGRIELQVK